MIAITFALRAESAHLAALLRDNQINRREVRIWHTGVGQKHSRLRMNQLLDAERPDLLISSGFAGGVHNDLRAGDLILAENFSDQELLHKAQQILSAYRVNAVKLFTSTTMIHSIAERNEIARANDAAAVDMEAAVIAAACGRHGVPMLSLRVISDGLLDPLPAPPAVLFDVERQRTEFAKLLAYLLRNPNATWRLFKFSRQIARAREVMTSAIVALLKKL
jgi:adenosylhomocysteine nucleosidase